MYLLELHIERESISDYLKIEKKASELAKIRVGESAAESSYKIVRTGEPLKLVAEFDKEAQLIVVLHFIHKIISNNAAVISNKPSSIKQMDGPQMDIKGADDIGSAIDIINEIAKKKLRQSENRSKRKW